MSVPLEFVAYFLAALVVALVSYQVVRAARVYFKLRGKRLVTCPENHRPAGVEIDARHAAREVVIGALHPRLKECSRWPEKQGCGQECLRQIESAPDGCLVRSIVTRWYQGKSCAICGRPIHEVEWIGHKPALLDLGLKTVYWDTIPVDRLPEVFATYAAICWDCHISQSLRRKHPEVIVERPWRW